MQGLDEHPHPPSPRLHPLGAPLAAGLPSMSPCHTGTDTGCSFPGIMVGVVSEPLTRWGPESAPCPGPEDMHTV